MAKRKPSKGWRPRLTVRRDIPPRPPAYIGGEPHITLEVKKLRLEAFPWVMAEHHGVVWWLKMSKGWNVKFPTRASFIFDLGLHMPGHGAAMKARTVQVE